MGSGGAWILGEKGDKCTKCGDWTAMPGIFRHSSTIVESASRIRDGIGVEAGLGARGRFTEKGSAKLRTVVLLDSKSTFLKTMSRLFNT